jgi:hypothetical protein
LNPRAWFNGLESVLRKNSNEPRGISKHERHHLFRGVAVALVQRQHADIAIAWCSHHGLVEVILGLVQLGTQLVGVGLALLDVEHARSNREDGTFSRADFRFDELPRPQVAQNERLGAKANAAAMFAG